MKRLFILATAAIVALASCAKTEVVYTDAPAEIGFKAFTSAMTKAPVTDATFPIQPMTVYGWNNDGKVEYFPATTFTHNGVNWAATPAQYYPSNGALDFVAFTQAPETGATNTSYDLRLADNTTNQHDLMASQYVAGKTKASGVVQLPFHHTLALIQVNFKCTGTNVQINSVQLTGTKQAGGVTVTYAATTDGTAPTVGTWAPSGEAKSLTKTGAETITAGAAEFVTYANFLAVPENGDDKALNINYTLNGNNFTHPIDIDAINAHEWAPGTKYVFDVTIGLTEVLFSATVEAWTPASVPAQQI